MFLFEIFPPSPKVLKRSLPADRLESSGPLTSVGFNYLCEVGRRISASSGDPRETSSLFQRLSGVIQRFKFSSHP